MGYGILWVYVIVFIFPIPSYLTTEEINMKYNKIFVRLPPANNIVYSPFNVELILAFLYQGAHGHTAEVLEDYLMAASKIENAEKYQSILEELQEGKSAVFDSNILIDPTHEARQEYLATLKNYFSVEVNDVSISTDEYMDVDDVTEESKSKVAKTKIDQTIALDDLDDNSLVVLWNALHFDSKWAKPFTNIESGEFFGAEYKFAWVDKLSREDYYLYREEENLDARIIKIPYKDPRFNLIIVAPNSIEAILELENNMLYEDISVLTNDKVMTNKLILLQLPLFEIEDTLELGDALNRIGLWNPFSYCADFSSLIKTNKTAKFYKYIQTTSFAVTVSPDSKSELKPEPVSPTEQALLFNIDHPFLFYVTVDFQTLNVDNNILFMGKVSDIGQEN